MLVLLAVDVVAAVMLTDELNCLPELVLREAAFHDAQIELADKSPCHRVAVQDRSSLLEGQTFESMTCSVAEVERLAKPFFRRVFLDDALLDGDTLCHQRTDVLPLTIDH